MRKIVVIGSNSFSGQDFVDLLLEDPQNEVIGLSRSAEVTPLMGSYHRHGRDRFRFYKLDLNKDAKKINELLESEKPEYIVNFAAQSEVAPSWEHPEHWFQTNTVGLINAINPLRDKKWLKRYVHISSPEVYGTCVGAITEESPVNPSTPYAASKAAADMFLSTLQKNFDFPLVSIRATNVYGSRQQLFKIIPRSIIYQKLGKKIQLHGGGVAVKSYIHIRDISRGELAAMLEGENGQMYHLSPDQGVAVRDVVSKIADALGNNFSDVAEAVEERLGQDAAYVIDSNKARETLNWNQSISIDEGISETVKWAQENWDEIKEQPLQYIHKA